MVRNSDMLIAELVAGLQPVKPLRFAEGFGLTLLVAALSTLASVAWLGLRADLGAGAVNPLHLISTGLYLGLGVAASMTVVVMSRPCVGTDHSGWTYAAAMAALLPVAGLIVGIVGGHDLLGAESLTHGLDCFVKGGAASLGVFAALAWWLRRGAPTAPDSAGMVAGVAAGSFGAFAFSLSCADNDIVHIGVWHSAVVLAAGALGRMVMPSLVRW
jgi:hypothetical protein